MSPAQSNVDAGRQRGSDVAGRSTARRIGLGVVVAFAYVGILAAAGLFISRAVNSVNTHSAAARAVEGLPLAAAAPEATAPATTPPTSPHDSPAAVEPPFTVPAAASVADDESPLARTVAATPPESPPAASAPPASAAAPPQTAATPAPKLATPAASPAPAPNRADTPPTVAAVPSTPAAVTPPPATAPRQPATALAAPQASQPPVARATPQVALPLPATPESEQWRLQGDERLREGDIASARLFYERAADAGNAQAALLLGTTFDPQYLERWGVRGMPGDVAQAASWYRRAGELGAEEADQRLRGLPTH